MRSMGEFEGEVWNSLKEKYGRVCGRSMGEFEGEVWESLKEK